MCRTIDEKPWLMIDYRLECFTEEWTQYALVSVAGFFIYPIGCPLFYLTILKRNRHKLFTDPKCLDRYGFIYDRYEEEHYWCRCPACVAESWWHFHTS